MRESPKVGQTSIGVDSLDAGMAALAAGAIHPRPQRRGLPRIAGKHGVQHDAVQGPAVHAVPGSLYKRLDAQPCDQRPGARGLGAFRRRRHGDVDGDRRGRQPVVCIAQGSPYQEGRQPILEVLAQDDVLRLNQRIQVIGPGLPQNHCLFMHPSTMATSPRRRERSRQPELRSDNVLNVTDQKRVDLACGQDDSQAETDRIPRLARPATASANCTSWRLQIFSPDARAGVAAMGWVQDDQ
jgi:hypothetical protein